MSSNVGSHSQLSIDQLKNALISHKVPLPQADQKKAVYLQLYLKHVLPNDQEAADFSSDDEELMSGNDLQRVEEEEENEERKMDVRSLSNTELKEQLLKHGVKPGPILPSTRGVYERKLQQLLEVGPVPVRENGAADGDRFSDSEEEGSPLKNRFDTRLDADIVNGIHNYCKPNMEKRSSSLNLSYKREDDKGLSPYSQPEESTLNTSNPMAQYALGLSATCRKPIKGAAGRPIQFRYDDLAVRARVQEMTKPSEAEKGTKRMVSVSMQIIAFVVIAFMALVLLNMESNPENPFTPLAEETEP